MLAPVMALNAYSRRREVGVRQGDVREMTVAEASSKL